MAKNRKTPGSPRDAARGPVALELSPDGAFVLHLDARAQPPRRVVGRVEHVTSGKVAQVASLRELVAFLTDVLLLTSRRDAARWRRTRLRGPIQNRAVPTAHAPANRGGRCQVARTTREGKRLPKCQRCRPP